MRQDEGWRWLRNSSGIVATVCGLIVLPVITVVAVIGLLVPFTMNGCEYREVRSPEDLGLTIDNAGAVLVRVPSCHRGEARGLRLVDPEGAVLWLAEASEPRDLREFQLGVAPEGFTDTMAYQGPLDPAITYDMQLLATLPDEPTPESPGTLSERDLDNGARARFRRMDLAVDQVFFDDQTVTAGEFDGAACGNDRS